MTGRARQAPKRLLGSLVLTLLVFAGCSSEEAGCKNDNDCKGDRICHAGNCTDPSSTGTGGSAGVGDSGTGGLGTGGLGTGGLGTGGSTATGGSAGCPSECRTSAGTCCQGDGVCDITPPCSGNPCCS